MLLSSSRTIFLNKLKNWKQTLIINNGFPNYIVDTEIKQFINKPEHNTDNILNHEQSINLYYKNQFHSNYKIDEHILKNLSQKKKERKKKKKFSLSILPKK